MTWQQRVIWSEGLFLQPQHFQQHDRFIEAMVRAQARALVPWCWGFAGLQLDELALGLGKVALARATGLLPDGTHFGLPLADPAPQPLEVPADCRDELVVLAVPLAREGAKEADIGMRAANGRPAESDLPLRWLVTDTSVADHVAGCDRVADMQVGAPNLRLMLAREATDAWAWMGVARVAERLADNRVVLDHSYVPPMLHATGHRVLADYLREILGALHQRGEALAERLTHPGRGGVAEVADFLYLQAVNRYEPQFGALQQLPLLHPERLHALALALCGDLSVFRDRRRPAELPAYRHDDLAASFAPLMHELRQSLAIVPDDIAVAIPLQDRKFGVHIATIGDLELVRSAGFVLAVNAQMPSEAVRVRFPTQVTVAPVERIRDLVRLHLPGIGLRALPIAPRQIPFHAGFNYFELDRSADLWRQLEQTGNLAMHIAGEFPGLEMEFWAIRQ